MVRLIVFLSLLGLIGACDSPTKSQGDAPTSASGETANNQDCDKPVSPCVQKLVRAQVQQELAKAMSAMTQSERRSLKTALERVRTQKEATRSDMKPDATRKKTEISALEFHVGRHKKTCACKAMTGPGKADCLKDAKDWELSHTIKKVTKKPSPAELQARGKKIQEALSKIPCGGPK